MSPPEIEKPLLPTGLTANGSKGKDQQLKDYAEAKAYQETVLAYIVDRHPELVKQAAKMERCGGWLWFRDYQRVQVYLLRYGSFCKQHILCKPCAYRRSRVYTQVYKQAVACLLGQNPSWVPILITKTIRNRSNLEEAFEHLARSQRRLIQARRDSFKSGRIQNPTVYAQVHAGAGSYEFKRGAGSGLWHPHCHEIALIDRNAFELCPVCTVVDRSGKERMILSPREMEDRLSEEWLKITGDSHMVNIRVIDVTDPDNFRSAVNEVMKYALKYQGLEPADLVTAYFALRTRRLVYTFGALRDLEIPEEYWDKPEIDLTDEPFVEEERCWKYGQYVLNKVRQPDQALFPGEPSSAPQKQKKAHRRPGAGSRISSVDIQDWMNKKRDENTPF